MEDDCEDMRVTSLACGTVVTFTEEAVHVRDPVSLKRVTTFRTRLRGQFLEAHGTIHAVTGNLPSVVGGGGAVVWWDVRTGDRVHTVGGANVRGDALTLSPNLDKNCINTGGISGNIINGSGISGNIINGNGISGNSINGNGINGNSINGIIVYGNIIDASGRLGWRCRARARVGASYRQTPRSTPLCRLCRHLCK
ncbi:hypothetical protein FHG87_020656 [Trinorchestia longiramus]|nr:hypothetical protein FHG87_020656 [Trinorchestia longiramus]